MTRSNMPVATGGWTMPVAAGGTVVLVAGHAAAEAHEAIALAGCSLVAQDDWGLTDAALDDPGAVLLIEAEGVAPETLAAGLTRIAALAGEGERRIVAVLGEAQIDMVAAALLGLDAALLVEPTQAERIVALIAATGGAPAAAVREDERERLARLNGEIARIADMLMRLSDATRPDLVAHVADGGRGYRARPGGATIDPQVVRQAIRARRMRGTFFPPALFEDPAWDMLLDLFAAELEATAVSVSSLCIAAAVAPTTALRWIGRMTAGGLLARKPDPGDRRRAFIVLTDTASAGMRGYAAALARAELPFV